MAIVLSRVDDRLIHGQVVIGWGRPLGLQRIVLVDDQVRASDWEQELYRMGMPPGMTLEFASVPEAIDAVPEWTRSNRRTLVVAGDLDALVRLVEGAPAIRRVNIGGVHQRPERRQRLPYVYLSDAEAAALCRLVASGIDVSAQDVPTARPVPLLELK